MKQRGIIPMAIFAVVSFWGILAMLSQATPQTERYRRLQNQDLAPARHSVFRSTVPDAVRRATLHSVRSSNDKKEERKRLTLR